MGREGESVRQLMPAFEREHPDIHVRVDILPWKGAHEKLLTAFAGDTTPDLCQLGNTWVAELAALGALEPLGARVTRSRDGRPGTTTSRASGTPTASAATLYGMPWYVDTRLLFYRTDILARAGFDHPPASWAEWARQMAAIKRHGRPVALRHPAAAQRVRTAGIAGPAAGRSRCCATTVATAISRPRASSTRCASTTASSASDWAPTVTNAEVSNPWAEFGQGYFAFYLSGPWNIAEFRKRLPADEQEDWATAPLPGPDGPGASLAGGVLAGDLPPSHAIRRPPGR